MTNPFLPFALPEIGDDEIAKSSTRCARAGSPRVRRRAASSTTSRPLGDPGLHCVPSLRHRGSAPRAGGLGHRPGGRGHHDHPHLHRHRRSRALPGGDVKLVDIDPATLNIDPAAVKPAITPRTRALIPVHYAGLAADMPALLDIARRHGLTVVEDAAHALPATLGGQLVARWPAPPRSSASTPTRPSPPAKAAAGHARRPARQRAQVMRLHGMHATPSTASRPRCRAGIRSRGAGLQVQPDRHRRRAGPAPAQEGACVPAARAQIAAQYDLAFAGLPLITPPRAPAGELHAWHLYVLRLAAGAGIARDRFIERLFDAGIGCSVHYIPLHCSPTGATATRCGPRCSRTASTRTSTC